MSRDEGSWSARGLTREGNLELAALDESLTLANLELQDARMEDLDPEAALEAASVLLTSTSSVWEAASAPKKRRLQPLLFSEGITFDGKAIPGDSSS